MENPSLAMIPAGYKASKIYSQLPTNRTGDFVLSRASTATIINEFGIIETIAINVPRLDYKDGDCPTLLLEPVTTNLITYSEDLTNASWVKTGLTVTGNDTTSPRGTLDADTLHITATLQFLVKTLTSYSTIVGDYMSISIYTNASYQVLTFGGSTIAGTDKYNIEQIKNTNWYKQTVVRTFTVATTGNIQFLIYNPPIGTLNLWGAQAEKFNASTSYIPTVASTVTRSADIIVGQIDSNNFNSSEGSIFVELKSLVNKGTYRAISISDGTATNQISIYFEPVLNTIRVFENSGGSLQANLPFTVADVTVLNKVAVKWGLNNISLFINGAKVNQDLVNTPPIGLNQLNFNRGDGGDDFTGGVKEIQVFKTALTDTELISLTT